MPVYTKKGLHYCVYYNNAKRVWEPFGRGPVAKKAAEARDLEIKLQKKRGQWNNPGSISSVTYSELAQTYMDHRKIDLSAKTRHEIFQMLTRYVISPIGNKPVNTITMRHWNKIQDSMIKNGAGARTINTYFRYLNKIFKWGVANGYLKENPWKDRESLRQKKYTVDLFTVDEFQQVLDAAAEHLAWAMEVAYYTGMRPGPSELFALTWDCVDFKNNRVRIYATKTDSYRWQYLDPGFVRRMETRYRESRQRGETCPHVCSYRNQPVKSLKVAWNAAKKRAGVKKPMRLYDIRHFYITHALANGASIMDLAERVGHVDATMIIKVYSHMVEELKTKQAFQVPSLQFQDETVDQTVDIQIKRGHDFS